jgi:hypothetical protein
MLELPDWPVQARDLLGQAVERYGGDAAWARLRHLSLRPAHLSGLLASVKGLGRTFNLPGRVDIDAHQRRAVFHDYPGPGKVGIFDGARVGIADAPAAAAAVLHEHRASFRGWHKWRRWSATDALYFFGYALTYYHALPWLLRSTRFVSLRATGASGAQHALEVEFPPEIHTHGPIQTFFFDATGLIVRHDYTAEIVSNWARGCHFWRDYQWFDGVPLSMTRHVRGAVLGRPGPLTVVHATFADVRLGE